MKTPEYWSEKIYKECYSPVMGHASVKPDFVAQIQADARAELLAALETVKAATALHAGCGPTYDAVCSALANNQEEPIRSPRA